MVRLVVGRHVYGDLYGSPRELLSNREFLVSIVEEAVREGGASILETRSWVVGGEHGGVSVIVLIVESHVALHTWPENEYATLDVYTCGEKADPWKIFNYIVKALKPKHYIVHYSDRSQLPLEL